MIIELLKESTEIMFDKLKEMSNVTFDDCESTESYAMLCSAMCDIYNAITDEK